MANKLDKPKPGESLSAYLVRLKAHPKLTPPEERKGMTEEDLRAAGSLLPDDHPIYTQGYGVGLMFKGNADPPTKRKAKRKAKKKK